MQIINLVTRNEMWIFKCNSGLHQNFDSRCGVEKRKLPLVSVRFTCMQNR